MKLSRFVARNSHASDTQNLYNVEYRQHSESKYTYENGACYDGRHTDHPVCIVPGGRAGLSRYVEAAGDD